MNECLNALFNVDIANNGLYGHWLGKLAVRSWE